MKLRSRFSKGWWPLLLVPAAVGVMAYAKQIAADFWAIAGVVASAVVNNAIAANRILSSLVSESRHKRGHSSFKDYRVRNEPESPSFK